MILERKAGDISPGDVVNVGPIEGWRPVLRITGANDWCVITYAFCGGVIREEYPIDYPLTIEVSSMKEEES